MEIVWDGEKTVEMGWDGMEIMFIIFSLFSRPIYDYMIYTRCRYISLVTLCG